MKRCVICFAAILAAVLAPFAPAVAADVQGPVVLAVHPYLPSVEIQKRFAPLAKYLGKVMQRPVMVRVGRDYDAHVAAIGGNEVDIAFMGPSPYVLMVARHEKKPLLARIEIDGKPQLSGVIIARTDSPLKGVADLKGKRFAFGDRESTMSSLVPQAMLQQAGVSLPALAAYDYLGGHKSVALGVLSGSFDAGAIKTEVFDEYAARGLRVLARMPVVSEHLFVTRSNILSDDVEKLRKALLNLKTDPEGMTIMQSINKGMTNMVAVSDADYQSLREMMTAVGAMPK